MATRNNTLLIKRSNVPGKVPTSLKIGELALNTADVKLYASGTTENQILQIGWDKLPFITGTTAEPSPTSGDKFIIWDASSSTHKNIDWDDLPGAGGGETNTASNLGVGQGVFSGKSGTDLQFYSLSGGTNTTLRLSNNTIVIDGLSSLSAFTLNDLSDVTTGIPGSPTVADDGRMLHYDFASGQWISDDSVNHGTVVINAKKSTAGTIAKGTPVYLVGFDSDLHTVETANATSSATMPVIGFAAEELDNTNTKHVITFGKIQGIDTTSGGTLANGEVWNINDDLYVDVVTGELTKVRPTGASTQIQRIAKVLNVDASGGQLFIFNTARTAGLPNLTENNIWVGNSSNQPIETTIKYVTGGTLNSNSIEINRTDTTNILSISGGTNLSISEPFNGVFKIDSTVIDTNYYVSGGSYNTTNYNINFSGNTSETTFDVDLTNLYSSLSGDTYLIAGTYSDTTDTIALLRNDGQFVNITGITDNYVTGATLNNNSIEVDRDDTSNIFSISGGTDLSISEPVNGVFKIDSTATDTNDYVTGATLNSNSLEVNRTDELNVFSISGGTNVTITEPTTGVFKIDTTGSSNPLIAMTMIENTSDALSTYDVKVNSTTTSNYMELIQFNIDGTDRPAKVDFTAPSGGNVKVVMNAYFNDAGGTTETWIGLHDSTGDVNNQANNMTYGWYEITADEEAESHDLESFDFVLRNLSGGTDYTVYFYAIATTTASSFHAGRYNQGNWTSARRSKPVTIEVYDLGDITIDVNPT